MNNMDRGFEFFRYAGYISFAPQVLTYVFSFLPYLLQASCYALTALLVGLWMLYQFAAILTDAGVRPRLAIGVTLVAVACLHFVCQEFYLNLTFSIWSALIGASIYTVRIALVGTRPHWFPTIVAALSFASHPLAVASLPVIGAGLYVRRARLETYLPHAIVLALGILLVVGFTEASRNVASPHTILETLALYWQRVQLFDPYHWAVIDFPIIIVVGGIVVGLVRLPSLIKSGSTQAAALLCGSLYFIPAYLGLYLASGRFTISNIDGRFFTPVMAFAILALTVSFAHAPGLVALVQRLERMESARAQAFLAAWLVVSLAAGPAIFWNLYANRLQFLATAQCMRDRGLAGIAIAAEDHEGTLAIANGHFKQSSWDPGMAELEPSSEPLAELQAACPGLRPSYAQAVSKAHIWIGGKAF